MRTLLALLASAGLGSCTMAYHHPVSPENVEALLFWTPTDGVTRRDDAIRELGPPHAEFEMGAVLCWRLGSARSPAEGRKTGRRWSPDGHVGLLETKAEGSERWSRTSYSLVLVFEGDVVREHRLLHVRCPLRKYRPEKEAS